MAKHAAKCPKCGSRLDYDSAVGDRVVCAHCQASLVVPATAKAPATPADPLIGETLGPFEILELLGRGGMGAVYKARQASLGRFVALKVLPEHLASDESFVERFSREARSAAAIRHPNIIEVFDVGQAMGHEYIAMEFIDGETLGAVLKREGRLAPDRALAVMTQAASALAGAHECRILHRDIKPSNILLDRKGRVKVADFGLAKHEGTDVSVTVTGQALGTPLYMPPEAARGEFGPAGDLYSLGATFYQALTGRPPFQGTTGAELIVKHLEDHVPPLQQLAPDCSPALCRVVHRLLRKNPADRYPSAEKLLDALGKLEASVVPHPAAVTRTLAERPPTAPQRPATRRKDTARRAKDVGGASVPRALPKWLLGAAGVALLVLVVALILVLRPKGNRPSAVVPSPVPKPGTRNPKPGRDAAAAERNAAIVLKNVQICIDRKDFAKAQAYLDKLAADYRDTKVAAAHKRDIAALQQRIDAYVKGTAEPQPPKPQPGQPVGAVKVTLRRALDVKTNGIAAIAPVGNQLAWAGPKHSGGFNVALLDALDKPQWIRARPNNPILCLAWGGDRQPLAACGDPWGAAVWDRTNVTCKLGYKGQKSSIHAVAVSPDATRLASGSSDKSVWLWDIRTSNPVWKREAVLCFDALAFTPDGRLLVCGGPDGKVHLLNADTGKTERELTGHEGRIHGLAISLDGTGLATASEDRTVRLWDLKTGAPRHTLAGHTDHVGTVAFSRDGVLVASGGKDSTARLWDARTGRLLHTMADHKAAVRTVAFSSAEDLLITAGEDGLRLWDVTLVAAAQAPPPDDEARWGPWKDLFDGKTLKGWSHRLNRDGSVDVEDGRIYMRPGTTTEFPRGQRDTGLAYTGDVPRDEYEVAYEAMRVAGRYGFASLTFPVGEGECELMVGGGQGGRGFSLEGIGEPPVRLVKDRSYRTGQWYHIRVRVAGGRVQVWVDEEQVFDFERAGHRFVGTTVSKGLAPLGLACHMTHAAYRSIRLRRRTLTPAQEWTRLPNGWVPLGIAASCTADVISTSARKSADQFTHNGSTLASASWLRKNGYREPGLPDDGRVPIPGAVPPGFFQVNMPPARNAMLVSGPDGVQPRAITVDLDAAERRAYSALALLYSACWGTGTLRVTLHYDTGAESAATMPVVDWNPQGRNGPLPTSLRVAVTTRDTHPAFGKPGEMLAQRIPADPHRTLRSVTFAFDSLTPPPGVSEQDARLRFTVGIFAISALPAAEARWGPWADLFDGKTLDAWQARPEKGRAIDVRPATRSIENGGGALVWTKPFPTIGYEVSMEARRNGGNDFANLRFPVDDMSCNLVIKPDMVSLNEVRGPGIAAHAVDVRAPRDVSQWHTYRLRVLADRIGVWVDEKPVIDFHRDGHTFRCFQGVAPFSFYTFMGQGAYRNIRLRRLDVEPRAAPGKPAP